MSGNGQDKSDQYFEYNYYEVRTLEPWSSYHLESVTLSVRGDGFFSRDPYNRPLIAQVAAWHPPPAADRLLLYQLRVLLSWWHDGG